MTLYLPSRSTDKGYVGVSLTTLLQVRLSVSEIPSFFFLILVHEVTFTSPDNGDDRVNSSFFIYYILKNILE